jgi:hypothetical protein
MFDCLRLSLSPHDRARAGETDGGVSRAKAERAAAIRALRQRATVGRQPRQGGAALGGSERGGATSSPSPRRRRATTAQAARHRALHRGGAVVRGGRGRGSAVVRGSPGAAAGGSRCARKFHPPRAKPRQATIMYDFHPHDLAYACSIRNHRVSYTGRRLHRMLNVAYRTG